ncbi:MAG: hypothetical protein AAGJ82_03330 [Bacteroidota bacterium]
MSNELDNKIADKLRSYRSPVDAEALWQAVQPEQPQRPKWIWWFGWFGLLLLVGGLAWWVVPSSGEDTTLDTSTEHSTAVAIPQEQEVDPVRNPSSTSAATSTKTPAGATVVPSLTPESERRNTAPVIIAEQTTASNTVYAASSPASEALATKTELGTSSELLTDAPATATYPETITAITGAVATSESGGVVTSSLPTTLVSNQSKTIRNREVTHALPSKLSLLAYAKNTDVPAIITPAELPTTPRRRTSAWFADLRAVYLLPQRTLTGVDSLNGDWIAARATSEQTLEAISLTGTVGYQFRNGWSIRTGVGRTQLNTVFNDTQISSTVDSVEAPTQLIFAPNGAVDTVYGMVPITTTATRVRRTYNQLTQWEIPVLVGYTQGRGKWRWELSTGPRFQVQQERQGTIWAVDNESFENWANTNGYRTDLSVSWQIGGDILYKLRPNLSVGLNAQARFQLNDLTADDADFQERYQLFGGGISLRYGF